jgi:Mrp family chromosome partitioning ATPase/capsular polysaccharide biosynthesis protein
VTDAPAEQKDLRAYLKPVLDRWWLILAVVPLVTIGTYIHYDGTPKVYSAQTALYFQPSTLSEVLLGHASATNESDIQNLALLVQTPPVAERARKLLKEEKGKPPVRGGVVAAPVEKTSFMTIDSSASTPEGAARIANAYARAFIELQADQLQREAHQTARTAERQLKQQRKNISESTQSREALVNKLQTLRLLASQPGGSGGIKQVEPAIASPTPIGHEPTSKAIFAFFVSLLLAIGAAYALAYMNRKIGSVEDAEEVYELPVLTEVPKVDTPALFTHQGAAMDEALSEPFHRLQTNLEMVARNWQLRTILVASAVPGEGKSIVARNLALAYREAGRNVAVLDADLRSASLGSMLAANQGPGLAEILSGRASFGQVAQQIPAPSSNGNSSRDGQLATAQRGYAAVVPAGQHYGNLSTALSSGQMREALRDAADTYGTAIIDSPPLLAVADVLPLLSEVDGVVLVSRLGLSTRDSARRLLNELRRVPNLSILGLVVNGVSPRTYRARSYGRYSD